MKSKTVKETTRELWARLFRSPTANQYITENNAVLKLPRFSEYITALCKKRGETPEQVIKRGCIERSYGHYIFRGTRNPSRDTVLQLAFGLELDADETRQLLKIARMSALHPKVKRDAVIAHCLHNHVRIMKAQQSLSELELPTIRGVFDE